MNFEFTQYHKRSEREKMALKMGLMRFMDRKNFSFR